jgi:hypothetical protein
MHPRLRDKTSPGRVVHNRPVHVPRPPWAGTRRLDRSELPSKLEARAEALSGPSPQNAEFQGTPPTPGGGSLARTSREALAFQDAAGAMSPDQLILPKDNDEEAVAPLANSAERSAPVPRAEPAQAAGSAGKSQVTVVLRRGAKPKTYLGASVAPLQGRRMCQAVAPGGAPAVGAGSNECQPSASTLAWKVVSADASNWRPNVQSVTLVGQVNVRPWPSNPASTAVPNTANPVDGGNITQANFQGVIDDMADYHTPGGGAGPDWHSTGASSAHEWAHWNTDWIADSVLSAGGGHWAQANTELDALRQPKASSPTPADARTALEGRVNARMTRFNNAAIIRWNAIPDLPGVPGSTGYDAGAAVLAGIIGSVRAYATRKGWLGGGLVNPGPNPGP